MRAVACFAITDCDTLVQRRQNGTAAEQRAARQRALPVWKSSG